MAISWGSWEYSGGNGMRVGIEATMSSVSHSSGSCTVTFKIYTDNQYTYGDGQTLNIGGTGGWADIGFTNNDGSSQVLRGTKTYTYNFDASDYGSGTAKAVTLSATISGAYNGVTPSKSVTVNIPNRPIGLPAAPFSQSLGRINDGLGQVNFGLSGPASNPITEVFGRRYDNLGGYTIWYSLGLSGSWQPGLIGGRSQFVQLFSRNAAGDSGIVQTNTIQTTPANPSACTVEKTSTTGTLVRWTNNQTTSGYSFTNLVQRRQSTDHGATWGAYATVGTVDGSIASYADNGLTAGYIYQYQVLAQSTVGDTLTSAPAESATIQLQQVPADPTGLTLTRGSDTSFTLNWADNPVADLAPYTGITVQRWDNVSNTWSTVASLSDTATTLTDTSTEVNRRYQWRVRAENAAGSSNWVTTAFTQTTPTAPTISAIKAVAGGGVRVEWANNVSYGTYTIGVRYYKNGALVDSTITVVAGETGYTLTGVDLTAKYKFGVRAVSTVGANLDSGWVDSAEISASTIPNAPSLLTPNGEVRDFKLAQVFTWQHNPSLDSSAQSAFEIQYSADGGTTWTSLGKKTQTQTSWSMPANTLTNGKTYTWQIRTWGVHATASAWSASASVTSSTTPVITLNSPSSTLTVSRIDVAWSYLDAEGTAQAAWEVNLLDGTGDLLEALSGNDTTKALTLATAALDGLLYTLRVRVRDASGLWSNWAVLPLTANFIKPAASILSADYSVGNGFVVLTLTPTTPEA